MAASSSNSSLDSSGTSSGDSLWQWSAARLRDETASARPTPGGGSIAMVSASLGLGLIIMALEITLAKRADSVGAEALRADLKQCRALLTQLSSHVDADMAAFSAYMAALGLPKATDDEKSLRRTAMGRALMGATQAPLDAGRDCVTALELGFKLLPEIDARVVSDVGAGAALLAGALQAVLLNVDINLPGLKDDEIRSQFSRQRQGLAGRAESLGRQLAEQVGRALRAE